MSRRARPLFGLVLALSLVLNIILAAGTIYTARAKQTAPPQGAAPTAGTAQPESTAAGDGAAAQSAQPKQEDNMTQQQNTVPQAADGCRQLIVVKGTGGAAAQLTCYQKAENGIWQQVLNERATIGKAGVSAAHQEGDMASPAGLYPLGMAFSTESTVPFAYPCRTITQNSWWVDDVAAECYNQWVEAPAQDGFASAEHLIDHPDTYHYGVVVEYNTSPVTPGAGSAIFLHCTGSHDYTYGCVAVPEATLLAILGWLDPAQAPAILIS